MIRGRARRPGGAHVREPGPHARREPLRRGGARPGEVRSGLGGGDEGTRGHEVRAVAAGPRRRGWRVRPDRSPAPPPAPGRLAARHLSVPGWEVERGPGPPDPPSLHVGLREPVFGSVCELGDSDSPKAIQLSG